MKRYGDTVKNVFRKQNNFIHSGGAGGGEDSSNLRKEEGKKQRGTWQQLEGVACKVYLGSGTKGLLPSGGVGVIFQGV